MRRNCIIILILITFSIPTNGYQLSLGNNLLVMNLFAPIENATTYRFSTSTPLIDDFFLDLEYAMYNNQITEARVDETNLLLAYIFNDIEIIDITTSLGLTITGDLSGGNVTDVWHKIVEGDDIHNYLRAETLFSKTSLLYESDINSGALYTDVFSHLSYTSSAYLTIDVGSALTYKASNLLARVGYLYGYNYNFDDFSILNKIKSLEDEGIAFLTIKAGHIQYDLNLLLNGSFSTGHYSIIFGDLPEDTELKFIDMKLIVGQEYDMGSGVTLNTMIVDIVPLSWFYSRFDFSIKSSYGINTPQFENTDLNELYYGETYYNRIVTTANANLFEHDNPFWFNPFLGVGLGVENYHYYGESSDERLHSIPIYELRAGFNLLLPQIFVKDNVQYGIHFASQYRDSLNSIDFSRNFLFNLGLTVAIEL